MNDLDDFIDAAILIGAAIACCLAHWQFTRTADVHRDDEKSRKKHGEESGPDQF